MRVLLSESPLGEARRDGVNAVTFRDDLWCRSGKRSRFACYDRDEEAMTTTYLGRNEETNAVWIDEADIEINAVDFRWSTGGNQGRRAPASSPIGELLVHELGHVLGLAHDCDDGFIHPNALDHLGNPPQRCDSSTSRRTAAMHPEPPPPGIGVRLSEDKRRTVCEMYGPSPARATPGTPRCSCQGVGGNAKGPFSFSALGVMVVVGVRRRSKRLMSRLP